MADRYPLVYNPSANQLQELQSGDSLDVGGTTIKNAVGYAKLQLEELQHSS